METKEVNQNAVNGNFAESCERDTSSKTGRTYELQRKIDEELRRLQLTQDMELAGKNVKADETEFSQVDGKDEDYFADKDGALIGDEKLNYQADVPVNHANSPMSSDQKRFSPPPSVEREINTFLTKENGDLEANSNCEDYIKPAFGETMNANQEYDTMPISPETDNTSDVKNSSAATTPTTTGGTYTLPPYSPETEGDVTEVVFPVDQIPATFRDHNLHLAGSSPSPQELDVSEISSDVFLHDHPMKAVPTEGSNELLVAETNGESYPQTDSDINQPDVTMLSKPETDVMEHESPQSHPNKEDLLEAETTDVANLEDSHSGDANSDFSSTEIKVHIETPKVGSGMESALSQQSTGMIETVEGEDHQSHLEVNGGFGSDALYRKISTDEDEYSGFDVDIGDPLSYQEDISIGDPEDNTPQNLLAESQIQHACDESNVPIFADVQYTVGEQVSAGMGNYDNEVDDFPLEASDENCPEIIPWDIVNDASQVSGEGDDQGSTDVAERYGSSRSISTNSDTEERATAYVSEKIAEEIVCNAIKHAYETTQRARNDDITMQNADDKGVDCESGTTITEKSCDNTGLANEGGEIAASNGCTTNEFNSVKKEDEGDVQSADSDYDTSKQYFLIDTVAAEAREVHDVTRSAGTEEELLNSEITEVALRNEEQCAEKPKADFGICVDATTKLAESNTAHAEEGSDYTNASKNESEQPSKFELGKIDTERLPLTTSPQSSSTDISNTGENQDTEKEEICNIVTEEPEAGEEDMMKTANESSPHGRHFPERITYNPALSQRNTEATKWFGQPTAEDKIWMRPSGKVDENAEQERRKLIKAMTRRHNPNLVPKWQPPKDKDLTEQLDVKQKASLEKYEARRRSKSEVNSIQPATVSSESKSPTNSSSQMHPPRKENIVIESVVHSRDAINVWESRLSEKQRKENLEKQRLAVGKQKKHRDRANTDSGRQRLDSNSSVSSNTSGVLPTSEYIERDSMNLSQVRNRWRNIEEESSKTKSRTNFRKEPSSKRTSSFSVNTGATYRSYQKPTPSPVKSKIERPEYRGSGGPIIQTHKNESFIDREIREAAEREERWKQEQWEKMSEASVASSEEVFPTNAPSPSQDPNVVTTIYTPSLPTQDLIGLEIVKDADREEQWKAEHFFKKSVKSSRNTSKDSAISSDLASPTSHTKHATQKDADSESLSSYGSSIAGNETSSPQTLTTIAQDKVSHNHVKMVGGKESTSVKKMQDSVDSGIDCNPTPPAINKATEKKFVSAPGEIIQSKAKVEYSAASTEDSHVTINTVAQDQEEQLRRKRIASLTSAVAPKGWEPTKPRHSGSLTQFSPVHRSVRKPEAKVPAQQEQKQLPLVEEPVVVSSDTVVSFVPPQFEEPQIQPTPTENTKAKESDKESEKSNEDLVTTKELMEVLEEKIEKKHVEKNIAHEEIEDLLEKREEDNKRETHTDLKDKNVETSEKKSSQAPHKRHGHTFEISSSKSRLQTIMEKEMRDAEIREEEWKQKQLEYIKQGIDISPHPVIHSTREIRTPTTSTPPPPVNAGEPVQVRRKVKSLFADDSEINTPYMNDDASDEYKKRTVVKANRVPRRKSNLAMRWEDGDFQNNVPEDE